LRRTARNKAAQTAIFSDVHDEHLSGGIRLDDKIGTGELLTNQKESRNYSRQREKDQDAERFAMPYVVTSGSSAPRTIARMTSALPIVPMSMLGTSVYMKRFVASGRRNVPARREQIRRTVHTPKSPRPVTTTCALVIASDQATPKRLGWLSGTQNAGSAPGDNEDRLVDRDCDDLESVLHVEAVQC
jgi:hypothetical protein